MFKKAFHIDNGETEMYEVDANAAVRNHPGEWSFKPWPEGARAKKTDAKPAKAVEPAPEKAFEAKHKGGGSYSVFNAAGEEVLDKLSKEDAELFNSSGEDAQEVYLKAEQASRASS